MKIELARRDLAAKKVERARPRHIEPALPRWRSVCATFARERLCWTRSRSRRVASSSRYILLELEAPAPAPAVPAVLACARVERGVAAPVSTPDGAGATLHSWATRRCACRRSNPRTAQAGRARSAARRRTAAQPASVRLREAHARADDLEPPGDAAHCHDPPGNHAISGKGPGLCEKGPVTQ